MARSLVAACLLFAGVWLLTSLGWALVAGAILTFALWPQGAETALIAAFRAGAECARRLASQAAAVPRRVTAVGGMTAGLLLVPAGLGLWAGVWAGLAAAGVLFIGLSLLAGQGA